MSVFPLLSFAAIELNTADQVALDGLNGLGPTKSKVILAERKKNGNFKSWADFERRVKGVGHKSALKLSEAGLVIEGQSFTESDAKASDVKSISANTKKHLSESQGTPNSK